jgi:Flp pilus assembly pilin Flp
MKIKAPLKVTFRGFNVLEYAFIVFLISIAVLFVGNHFVADLNKLFARISLGTGNGTAFNAPPHISAELLKKICESSAIGGLFIFFLLQRVRRK